MLPKIKMGSQRKLFTKREHRYCNFFKYPAPHYAMRWCAKEALLKASTPYFKLDLRKIEIANNDNGPPYFIINDQEFNKLNLITSVSMSHSKQVAMAIVLLTCPLLYLDEK